MECLVAEPILRKFHSETCWKKGTLPVRKRHFSEKKAPCLVEKIGHVKNMGYETHKSYRQRLVFIELRFYSFKKAPRLVEKVRRM